MVICCPQLGLDPKSILGGEVFDREILLGLAKKGIEIEIILAKDKTHDQNIKNWHITYLPITHFPAILANILMIPYLFNVYRKRRFEILRIHQPQFLGLGSIFFKIFNRKVKLLATYHQFGETSFGPFSKIVSKFWDHIITDSEYVKSLIIKSYKVSPSKITVVANGIPGYLKPSIKDRKLMRKFNLGGKVVLLFMGLFVKRKNPLFLLDVLKKLSQLHKNIVLIFWGVGPLKKEIIKRSKELKIYNMIRIIGPIFGPAKNKIHNLDDVFVHPSLDEGFALAPLEAMACAKPVVMTKGYSATEAVKDGFDGLLCRENDIEDWEYKLKIIISDRNLRRKMGKRSLKKIQEKFNWQSSVNIHFKVFKKIVK